MKKPKNLPRDPNQRARNLATALMVDAADKRFEHAWVITNDSDLAWPVEQVQTEYGLPIGVLRPSRPAGHPSPEPRHASPELKAAVPKGCSAKSTGAQLAACQFADDLRDQYGLIKRPSEWSAAIAPTDQELAD